MFLLTKMWKKCPDYFYFAFLSFLFYQFLRF